jgi:hypothetical protein
MPNLHPEPRAMEPACHQQRKIAKRTERENVNEHSPRNRAHWTKPDLLHTEVLLLIPRHAPTLDWHSAAGPRETNRHQAAGWG